MRNVANFQRTNFNAILHLYATQEELLQMKKIEKSLAVFCLATYGEGDPTDNAMEFWEWIQGDVDLTGLNYAVSILCISFNVCVQD